jgi:hypothetical protein
VPYSGMSRPDLNLLVTLDVLLTEGALRDGAVDLEIGALETTTSPDLRTLALGSDLIATVLERHTRRISAGMAGLSGRW